MDTSNGGDSENSTHLSPQLKPAHSLFKTTLGWILLIAIAAAGIWGIYYWQHTKLATADASISGLDKSVKTLSSKVSSLQIENQKVTAELTAAQKQADSSPATPPDQTNLTFTIDNASRFNILGAINTPENGVAVGMTITNPTASTIDLMTSSLELQDAENNVYQVDTEVASTYIPSGDVLLANQMIAPHQTVKGALYYMVDNLSLTDFTLLNGSTTYPVKVQ